MRLAVAAALALALALASCSAGIPNDGTPDLAAPELGVPDLAAPELGAPDLAAPPPDLLACSAWIALDGGLCAGTPLAGTCVESYFAAAADCFRAAGPCVRDANAINLCFCDGARVAPNGDYSNAAGAVCMTQQLHCTTGSSCVTYRPYTFTSPAGVLSWTIDELSPTGPINDVTCPGDGGTTHLDPMQCPSIARLAFGGAACHVGACP